MDSFRAAEGAATVDSKFERSTVIAIPQHWRP